MKKILFATVAGTLLFAACKKSSDDDTPAVTNTTRITATPWIYKSAGFDMDRNGTIDQALPGGTLTPCRLDNQYIFATNGAGTMDEGATKCDPANPQTVAFTWAFANNETEIELGGAALFGLAGRFKVWALNDTLLSMSRDTLINFPPLPPTNISILINLKH
ncbi:hypothetical protein [Flaviaesturariibacter amylovorans]|uniref:Lipocalin-like domain-containing protein n=1 Tax=Flaviaesturariibacter amylovorans TaxID=1084520 RepID=A0ABP8GDQ2_9BACT